MTSIAHPSAVAASKAADPVRPHRGEARLLIGVVAVTVVLGIARRTLLGLDRPLSLDESWTGAIAAAPDLATLVRRCLAELSGPVFYGTQWLWARAAGVSDLALRVPAIAAGLAMPLLILRCGHPDRNLRLVWAGIAAVWLPGTLMAGEARPYSLVLLIGTAQAIALLAFLRAPSRRRAWAWTVLTAAAMLTQYHSVLVGALQGLAILSRGRAAWRCWPALLAFVPVAGWMAWHLPTLAGFAAAAPGWYLALPPGDLIAIVPGAMFGLPMLGHALALAVSATAVWSLTPSGRAVTIARDDVIVALTGLAGLAMLVGLSLVGPAFSPRYVLPFMPTILFGVAAWAAAIGRRWHLAPLLVVATFLMLGLAEANARRADVAARGASQGFEVASEAIAATRPRRLIAFFDGPATMGADRAMLRDVGGFFLARRGQRPVVLAPVLRDPGIDPNRALPALADRPGDAILWIYNVSAPGTRGIRFPAAIPAADPRFRCRNYGMGVLAVIACVQGGAD